MALRASTRQDVVSGHLAGHMVMLLVVPARFPIAEIRRITSITPGMAMQASVTSLEAVV